MLLIISDASVLIDIECGGLTKIMFSLPWQFCVPDILFYEELSERHTHLLEYGLSTKQISSELIAEVYVLRQKQTKTSFNDLLALVLAQHEACQLLTSDKALREAAKELNVEVHGTIWLVQQMICYEVLTVEAARVSFQRMKEAGSRLPWGEVSKMLNEVEVIIV